MDRNLNVTKEEIRIFLVELFKKSIFNQSLFDMVDVNLRSWVDTYELEITHTFIHRLLIAQTKPRKLM